MNGRTVHKFLRHNMGGGLFGFRAWLSIRIPLDAFPQPYPQYPEGMRPDFAGTILPDGRFRQDHIGEVFAGTFLGATQDGATCVMSRDEPNNKSWAEGYTKIFPDKDSLEADETSPLDEGVVRTWLARKEWRYSFLMEPGLVGPAMDAFIETADLYASMRDPQCDGRRYAYVHYAVKSYHRNELDGFRRGIARAMRIARRTGFPVRVVRGC